MCAIDNNGLQGEKGYLGRSGKFAAHLLRMSTDLRKASPDLKRSFSRSQTL